MVKIFPIKVKETTFQNIVKLVAENSRITQIIFYEFLSCLFLLEVYDSVKDLHILVNDILINTCI